METVRADGPMAGVTVFDFARVIAGPYSATLLAQMGADVIRVEHPEGAEDRYIGLTTDRKERVSTAAVISHSKDGATLDLNSIHAPRIIRSMAERADVFVHNFSPGSKQAKLFDYDALKKINRRLIIAMVSGFGQSGPYSRRPCFDNVAQAMSGMMSYTGFPGSPPLKAAVPLVDFGTALHAALGIVAALYERDRSGEGQVVDVSLFDVATSFVVQSGVAAEHKLLGITREPFGNCGAHAYSVCARTKDGWVYINPLGRIWKRFLIAIDRDDLGADGRFADDNLRLEHRGELDEVVNHWTKERTTREVVDAMELARVPCGAVNTVAALFDDPQLKVRNMLASVDYPGLPELTVSGCPVKFSRTPGDVKGPAPTVGQDNEKIYKQFLGLTEEDFCRLRSEGAI